MRAVVLACTVGLATAFVTAPAHAATTFSQVSLTATVTGSSVTAAATIRAGASTVVQQYGICARDVAGKNVDFPAKMQSSTISTAGTAYSATRTFSPGTFTYYPCVLSAGTWSSVGKKTFTVSSTASDPAILFSDDFSGTAGNKPDAAKWNEWSSCTYNSSAAYGSIKCGERSTLDGAGHLSIPATPSVGTSVSTKDDFTFRYGTVTARMKIPAEGGYWPAFWTLNNNPSGHPNSPVVGEVDVLEAYTSLANGYRRAVHNWSRSTSWSPQSGPICGVDHVLGEWHDYAARIEPGKVTFLFDGHQCGAVTTKTEGNGKPYAFGPDLDAGNWLILTMAVGGASGQQDGRAVSPSQLLVDRVEVTAL